MQHALPISSVLTWSFWLHLAESTSYEASHYALFSNLLSLHPSSVPIFFSAPCFQTHSVCVLPSMSKSKFHTQSHRQNYSFVYSNFYIFRQHIRRQKILDWMVTSIAKIQSPLNFLLNQILICYVDVPKYLNCVTFWKDLLSIFMSWFCPAFWWRRDSNIAFSVFTSRPTSLLASKFLCFSFWYIYYHPVDSHHQHRPAADVSHLISVPPSFPGLS
jgi:hypothetical protein